MRTWPPLGWVGVMIFVDFSALLSKATADYATALPDTSACGRHRSGLPPTLRLSM